MLGKFLLNSIIEILYVQKFVLKFLQYQQVNMEKRNLQNHHVNDGDRLKFQDDGVHYPNVLLEDV